MNDRSQRSAHIQVVMNVETVDHHSAEAHHACRRWPEPFEIPTEFGSIKFANLECSAAIRRARQLRVIIRRQLPHGILEFCMVFEKGKRFRPLLEKCVDDFLALGFTGYPRKMNAHLFRPIFESPRNRLPRSWNPQRAS